MIVLRTLGAHVNGRHEYSKVVDNQKVVYLGFDMFLGQAKSKKTLVSPACLARNALFLRMLLCFLLDKCKKKFFFVSRVGSRV